MPIEFELKVDRDFDFVQVFAKHFHQTVTDNRVMLPSELGTGYIKEVHPTNAISLCLHKYNLKQAFVLKRIESELSEMLTIKFTRSGFFTDQKQIGDSPIYRELHSAEIITNNLFTQVILPPNQAIDFIVMNISRKALIDLLQLDNAETTLKNIISNSPSFVFYERMNIEMERTVLQMQAIDNESYLSKLQYKAKAYELIYQLFNKILTRHISEVIAVNQDDAEQLYALKAAILTDLSVAPQLSVLARRIGMSETKMKRLFFQIFGQSIYNYFQSARMNEAARLLTNLSVSETGYKLGFTNLSHFTRLFEKHHGIKPKRYKDSLFVNNNGLHQMREVSDGTNS